MFKILKEGNGHRNGIYRLGIHPPVGTEGECIACGAVVELLGENLPALSELKKIFKRREIKRGKRFSGFGWSANMPCPHCKEERTLFFPCKETTLIANGVNLDNPDVKIKSIK